MFDNNTIDVPEEGKEELAAGVRTNITCPLVGGSPVPYEKLEIEIVVTYRPRFWRTQCKATAFNGVYAEGRIFIWTYQGTNSNCRSK